MGENNNKKEQITWLENEYPTGTLNPWDQHEGEDRSFIAEMQALEMQIKNQPNTFRKSVQWNQINTGLGDPKQGILSEKILAQLELIGKKLVGIEALLQTKQE